MTTGLRMERGYSYDTHVNFKITKYFKYGDYCLCLSQDSVSSRGRKSHPKNATPYHCIQLPLNSYHETPSISGIVDILKTHHSRLEP